MSWVRSDDMEAIHPKMAQLSIGAFGFLQAAKQWASRNLTNGFVPCAALGPELHASLTREQAITYAEELATAKHPAFPDSAPIFEKADGGWRIHDYLDYNPSRGQVLRQRAQTHAAKVRAGRVGGQQRANRLLAGAKQHGSRPRSDVEQKPSPVPVPVPLPERQEHLQETALRGVRRAQEPEPGVRVVLDAHHEAFLARHGEKPNITAKDASIARQLVRRHGLDKVLEVMRRMYESPDPFIASAGLTLGVLSSQWNKLVAAPTLLSPRTAGNAQAARAFVEGVERDRR